MSTTTIKIDGEEINPAVYDAFPGRLELVRSGISTLTFTRRRLLPIVPSGPTSTPPDPEESLLNHEVQLEIDGVGLVFTGDVLDEQPAWTDAGWVTTYQARCLRNRGDWVPLIDSNTKTTTAAYNRPANDELSLPIRTGKTVGEVILDVLTMDENAAALDGLGIGAYTSLSPPTLPSATAADLAALDQIPPQTLAVSGGKLLSAVESFLESAAANHHMRVEADGTIRFRDLRDAVEQTLTLGDCDGRASMPSIRRSIADCWSAYELFGQPRTEAKLVSLANGGLERHYAYGAYSNDAAEAIWTPDDYLRSRDSRSVGTCTVTDTLHVVVDPTDPAQSWGLDAFAQDQQAGVVYLTVSVVSGVDSTVSRRVVANTALTAGGTSTITLDEPLPATGYTRFTLIGRGVGAAKVYREYRVVDASIRAALARKFSPDAVWIYADGQAATTTSYPMASIVWSDTGGPPYKEATDDFTISGDGIITFTRPTYNVAGKKPDDVRVLLAVTVGTLVARRPASGHEGTANSIYGLQKVNRQFQKSWTDPGNQASQEAYAQELLDAVKDVALDVSIDVQKLWLPALDFDNGLSIGAVGYNVGLESANLPIRSATIAWNSRAASHHTTSITASNRRGALQEANLVPPERPRQGFVWGTSDSVLSPGSGGSGR